MNSNKNTQFHVICSASQWFFGDTVILDDRISWLKIKWWSQNCWKGLIFIWTVMINDPRSGSIHSKSGIFKANSAKSQKSAIWGDDLRLGSVNQPQIVDNQFACPIFNFCNDEILIQRLNSTDKQILVKIFVVSAGNYFVNLAKSFILAIFTWRNIWHQQYNGIILCE